MATGWETIGLGTALDSGDGALLRDGGVKIDRMLKELFYGAILSQLSASLNRALIVNGATQQPLLQPAAWAASTAVYKGQSRSNGGNNYLCMVSGTTAASGGPTGTSNAAITDNTVTWYYAGPTYTSDANAPTFTQPAYASRYTTGQAFTNTASTRTDGATNTRDTGVFWITGCDYTETGNQNAITASGNGVLLSISFMTDAPSFDIIQNGGTGQNCSIYVDDRPLTLGYGSTNSNGGSVNVLRLVFPTRQPRKITCEVLTGQSFYGVLTSDLTSKVWAPSRSGSVRTVIVGTSYLSGSSQHPVSPSLGLGPTIARCMGLTDVFVDAGGAGTGYLNGGSPYSSRTARLSSYNTVSPIELIIVTGGGINDRSYAGVTQASETTAIQSYLSTLRSSFPQAPIIVIGSESGSTGPATNVFTMELAAANAVANMNDPMIGFVPQSDTTAIRAWCSGTGTTAATNNSGSAENYIGADGIHPVQAGMLYLAQRHANGIRALVNNQWFH